MNWLLRNRLISSTLTAAASTLPPRWADRISILHSLHPSTNEPLRQELIEAVEAGTTSSLERNLWIPEIPAQLLQKCGRFGSKWHRQVADRAWKPDRAMSDAWCLTLVSARVRSICFLRNLVMNRSAVIGPSRYRRGRIAPVVHHRRPHNIS